MKSMCVVRQMRIDPTLLVRPMHLPPHECTVDDVVVPLDEQRRSLALYGDLLADDLGVVVVGVEVPISISVPGCEFVHELAVVAFGELPGEREEIE